MKRIPSVFYLGVLLVCLVLAYFSWTRGPGKPGEAVPILDCEARGGLKQLTIRVEDRQVSFSAKGGKGNGEDVWWVKVFGDSSETAGQEKGRAEASGKDKAQPVWTQTEMFKGNQKLKDALAGFCRWEGLRSLGSLEEGKRQELGLADTGDYVSLEFESGPSRSFRIGDETFGSHDRYVEDDKNGRVYLVVGDVIKNLLHAKTRFMERSLHGFKREDVTRIQVQVGQEEKELIHLLPDQGEAEGWADSKSPDEARELYKNWVRKLFMLRIVGYMTAETDGGSAGGPYAEMGKSGCPVPSGADTVAEFQFWGADGEIGFLKIFRTAEKKADSVYSACTGNTGAVVTVSNAQADALIKDLADVLSEP